MILKVSGLPPRKTAPGPVGSRGRGRDHLGHRQRLGIGSAVHQVFALVAEGHRDRLDTAVVQHADLDLQVDVPVTRPHRGVVPEVARALHGHRDDAETVEGGRRTLSWGRLPLFLLPGPDRLGRLRLPGDSSINTGMECGGNVKARATTRFLWWTLHLTRDAAEAALLPSRSRKPGTGYGRRLAISRLAQGTEGKVCQSAARSYRSSTQPRQRAAEPRGSVSAFRPARRSAAGLCRTSTRSFRRGPSRGRRRKPEFVGDDGGGGA